MSWSAVTLKGDLPVGRGGHAAAAVPHPVTERPVIAIIGGADAFGMVTNAVTLVDTETGACSALGPTCLGQFGPRCSHAAVAVPPAEADGSWSVLVYGGIAYVPNAEPVMYDDVWALRFTATGDKQKRLECSMEPVATTGDQPGTRQSFASCLVGREWFVACGADGTEPTGPENTGYTNAVHALNVDTRVWRRVVADIGLPREMPAAAPTADGALLLCGGRAAVFNGGVPEPALSSTVYRVAAPADGAKAEVSTVADDIAACRLAHSFHLIGDTAYIVGGQAAPTAEAPTGLVDTDVAVVPATGAVKSVKRVDDNGAPVHFGIGHSAACLGDQLFVVGGLHPNTMGKTAVWRFAPPPAQ